MDEIQKREMYDRICAALTNYEDPQSAGMTECEAAIDMYELLVEIQNKWFEVWI